MCYSWPSSSRGLTGCASHSYCTCSWDLCSRIAHYTSYFPCPEWQSPEWPVTGLVTVCLFAGGVVTGASLRHCHAEAAPQLLFFFIYFPRDGENLGGGCLQLTCGPVSRGEAARHNGSTFIPLWESVLCATLAIYFIPLWKPLNLLLY